MGPRQRGDRRQAILAAATEVFYRKGYRAASVREIARLSEVTQAALYYHFKNKEEVLFTIVSEFSDQLFMALAAALSKDRDPIARLGNAIREHLLFTKTHRAQVKLVLEDRRFLSRALADRIKDKEKAIFNLYRAHLQELRDTGLIRPVELIPTTFSIFGVINFLYHWYRPEQRLSIEQVADATVDLLVRGLLADPPAPQPRGG